MCQCKFLIRESKNSKGEGILMDTTTTSNSTIGKIKDISIIKIRPTLDTTNIPMVLNMSPRSCMRASNNMPRNNSMALREGWYVIISSSPHTIQKMRVTIRVLFNNVLSLNNLKANLTVILRQIKANLKAVTDSNH